MVSGNLGAAITDLHLLEGDKKAATSSQMEIKHRLARYSCSASRSLPQSAI